MVFNLPDGEETGIVLAAPYCGGVLGIAGDKADPPKPGGMAPGVCDVGAAGFGVGIFNGDLPNVGRLPPTPPKNDPPAAPGSGAAPGVGEVGIAPRAGNPPACPSGFCPGGVY
jgi:hypothetical protein